MTEGGAKPQRRALDRLPRAMQAHHQGHGVLRAPPGSGTIVAPRPMEPGPTATFTDDVFDY